MSTGLIMNALYSKFSVPIGFSRGQEERLLKPVLGHRLQQTFRSLLTTKCYQTEVLVVAGRVTCAWKIAKINSYGKDHD